jgi:hypothetical protein
MRNTPSSDRTVNEVEVLEAAATEISNPSYGWKEGSSGSELLLSSRGLETAEPQIEARSIRCKQRNLSQGKCGVTLI